MTCKFKNLVYPAQMCRCGKCQQCYRGYLDKKIHAELAITELMHSRGCDSPKIRCSMEDYFFLAKHSPDHVSSIAQTL